MEKDSDSMNKAGSRNHMLLMALVILALLAALWSGLIRLGWNWPTLRPGLPAAHGPLMVSGFLGTLIGLERAVALKARWSYLGPTLSGLGAMLLIAGVGDWLGPLLMTLGSLGLVIVFALIIRRQPALFTATMGLGALVWLGGNALWLAGRPVHRVVLWWGGFLVLTIVGERLELSRLLRPSQKSVAAFAFSGGLFLTGVILVELDLDLGTRLTGAGMVVLTAWLLRHDVARRTVRQPGLPRFIGICLLSGYVWLGVSGLLALRFGAVVAGPRYDAMLHTLFLGFVFAMIFGHAPIIFPAVLEKPITFHAAFYAHLVMLHLSLSLRVAGDLAPWRPGRLWGGLLNAAVLLLFLANTGYAAFKATHDLATGSTQADA
jgi:hypothetical protein